MSNAGVRVPASRVTRDQVALLVEIGLKERGLVVSREDKDERYREVGPCLDIRGIPAAPASSLLVTDEIDDIAVRWEYCPVEDGREDPKRTADIATALLTEDEAPYERLCGEYSRGMVSYKGIVGRELKARGFGVELSVHRDEEYFDASAEIAVSRGDSGMRAVIDDSGFITWDADYRVAHAGAGPAPGPTASPASIEDIAGDIVARIGRIAGV